MLAGVVRLWSVKVTVVEATGKLFVSLTLAVAPTRTCCTLTTRERRRRPRPGRTSRCALLRAPHAQFFLTLTQSLRCAPSSPPHQWRSVTLPPPSSRLGELPVKPVRRDTDLIGHTEQIGAHLREELDRNRLLVTGVLSTVHHHCVLLNDLAELHSFGHGCVLHLRVRDAWPRGDDPLRGRDTGCL